MPNAKPFITLHDVSIRRQNQVVFEGLCWEMRSDQHWAVIGPNGSGKTTLVKALCGSLPVVKGRIDYHFTSENGHRSLREQIALVTFESQRMVLSDEVYYQARWNIGLSQDALSVSEFLSERGVRHLNPFEVIEDHPDPDFDGHRQDVVQRLELEALLGRQVVALSNGERRKVTIARALLTNPRLLILDSPFVGLDEAFRARLTENLEKLMQGEMRVLIVGTSRDEIPPSITHILCVQDNCVIAQGPRVSVLGGEAAARVQTASHLADVRLVPPSGTETGNEQAGKALVRMQDVNVAYNGTPVLRQVNWTVRENEQWALLGPNGAGKTTLLSLILADNPQAYANNITLFGQRRGSGESIWEIKRNIGWMAPELQLYYPRDYKCIDVVCSGWFDSVGLYRECSGDQHKMAQSWLARLGLTNHADRLFQQLAEGEQRLTLLARALVKSPTLLVLDEPCQGLDAANRDRVVEAIDGVGSQPHTSMIYVTHRADELPHTITHVLRLNAGQVVEQGMKRN